MEAAGGDLRAIHGLLRDLLDAKQQPKRSYAWFVAVAADKIGSGRKTA